MDNQEAIEVMFNEWKCIDRNDGVHCDRKCESCDLVMDVQIIREAFNKAISALEAQEAKNSKESNSTHKALPSAQPEWKKGCKIVKSTGHYGYCACDQCGKPVHPEDRFCSKCGADFREEDA